MAVSTYGWGDLKALRYIGQGLADAKGQRIAMTNRVERGGIALSPDLKAEIIDAADELEERYEEMLMDEYERVVPGRIRVWAAGIPGLGNGELFPRIIAAAGNPRIATPELPDPDDKKRTLLIGEPYERTLRQWWQYCGVGDPERVPTKGMSQAELFACGKRRVVRPLLYTFTSGLLRSHTRSDTIGNSKLWLQFEEARKAAVGNRHKWICKNRKRPPMKSNGCATVAHPEWGEPGSEWRPGHILAHAHRITAKELLRELWVVAGE